MPLTQTPHLREPVSKKTTTTTTTTATTGVFLRLSRLLIFVKKPSGRHERTRLRSAEKGAPAPGMAPSRWWWGPARERCETYDALRTEGTSPGKAPWCPARARGAGSGSHGRERGLPGAPLLVVPTLHGEDSVDGTTVSFLLAENLKLKKEEEEKERRRKLKAEGEARDVYAGNGSPLEGRRAAQPARRRRSPRVEVGLARPAFKGGEDEQEEEEEEEQKKAPKILFLTIRSWCADTAMWGGLALILPWLCRRPCAHAVPVPAVQGIREHEGASDSVHRQSVGHSCYATETGTHCAKLCGIRETPQVQCLGKVVDAPVVVQRQVPDGPASAENSRISSFCSWTKVSTFL